jgi:hypothetical protein
MIGMGVGFTVRRWNRSARSGARPALHVFEHAAPAVRVAAGVFPRLHERHAVSFAAGVERRPG